MKVLRGVSVSVAAVAVLALGSCAQPSTPPSAAPQASELRSSVSRIRVVNDSSTSLSDLRLLFPEDEVAIGDVAAGATSGYVAAPHGVYGYSAFRFRRAGALVVQPVIDFVGESPLPTGDYTYLLDVDPRRGDPIELVSVEQAAG